jgi:hypothetical protein
MAQRDLEEQVIHDRVVTALKKTLFKYPNDKHPNLKTHTNHPIKTHAINDHIGGQFYPDLVVLNARTEKVISAIEVETVNTINENEAEQWLKFASLGENFYLFFPRGFEAKVKELCRKISKVHCYEYWEDGGHYRAERITF